ncbi:MAG TPA: HPr-rel-A system PqqD family peptide chaperone [Vicinamibacterales bacterium]|jgi:PqqD family protein of HPr-rel-A system|nr:HPr-rel-A system PqqD family peptide chaperone [Vicinamibacterales bacterium]
MMVTFDESSVWERTSALPFQEMDDELVVVDPATRQVHLLNATAARIWMLLADARSLPTLVAALEEEFDAPAAALRAEVEAFLTEMSDKRLCASRSAER